MERKSIRLTVGVTAVGLLTAACSDGPAEPFSADQLPDVQVQQAPLRGAPGQEELVRSIPGFGGLYLDEDGVPTINVLNIDDVGDADLAVLGYLGRIGSDALRQVRVRQAEFTIPQLDEWFQATSPAVLGVDGSVFVDLDERANRLTIGVEDAGMIDRARQIAGQLGVPDDALQIVLADPILPMNSLRDRHRPVVGGLQINFPGFLCTLGFNAVAEADGGGGGGGGKGKSGQSSPAAEPQAVENSFITNSHCTNTQGGVEDTPYWQPLESVDPVQIGTEVEDPSYKRNLDGCPKGRVCRFSDAARARYDNATPFTLAKIARPDAGPNAGSVAWTTGNLHTITGEGTTMVGDVANKVGRTTGWTQGTVTATNVDTGVSGTNIVQLNQTFVESNAQIVAGGDSGSNVWKDAGGANVTLVGILWGGNSSGTLFVYSPITNVESELGNLETHSGDSTTP